MFRINSTTCSCGERFELQGRLTAEGVPELQKLVAAALDRGSQVALDLSELTFLDADGIRCLHELLARRVPMRGCSAFVVQVLGLR